MYDQLVTKFNAVDTSRCFFLKSQCNTDKSILENKIGEADTKTPDTN